MQITHTYPAVSKVYPVNKHGKLHLFSTPKAAETYAQEHDATLFPPMPVLTQKTLWNRVVLRFRGDGYKWDAYTVEAFINPLKERPATASRPSVRLISDPYEVVSKPKDDTVSSRTDLTSPHG